MTRPPLRTYLEACWSLAAARLAVLSTPSREHFEAPSAGRAANKAEREAVHRTLKAASRRLPFRTQCYERALAARAMLDRRHIGSRLHFGTGKSRGDLTAHVWLSSGKAIVVGEEEAASHIELAKSPE